MAYVVRLYHTVEITVSPVDTAATDYRTRAREPVLQVARATTLIIDAQVEWTERRRPNQGRSGREDKSIGYLVVLTRDLTTKGWTPTPGDKIVSIPDRPGTYYVTSATPHAHRRGKPRTMHVAFTDKVPAKRR
jgi:hypothetical protein